MMSPVILLTFAFDRRAHGDGWLRELSREQHAIESALRTAERAGRCRVVVLPGVTVEALTHVLDLHNDDIAGFHFGGHAGPGHLSFNTLDGELSDALSDGIAQRLGQLPGLRFVVLNGCATAEQRAALARWCPGVASVTTERAVRDEVAQAFAEQLYQALGTGATVGSAFERAEARIRLAHGTTGDAMRDEAAVARMLRPAAADASTLGGAPWRLDGPLAARAWRLPARGERDWQAEREVSVGRLLGGQYQIVEQVGWGEFGGVYHGRDIVLDRPVTIKVIHRIEGSGVADRLRREARVQARLRHPGIVRLLTLGEDPGGLSYLVQERVAGRSLAAEVAESGPLPPERVVGIAVELLDALDEAHHLGVVHRNIKPGNVLLVPGRRGDEVRLLDFGLARARADLGLTTLSGLDALVGTPLYMSPEQVEDRPATPRADLYALGCVLFFALTGRPPFEGSIWQVLLQHAHAPAPALPGAVPASLRAVVARALAKAPEDRYPSAEAMKRALLSGDPVDAPDDGPRDTEPSIPAMLRVASEAPPTRDGAPRLGWRLAVLAVGLSTIAALVTPNRACDPDPGDAGLDVGAGLDAGLLDALLAVDRGSPDAIPDVADSAPLDARSLDGAPPDADPPKVVWRPKLRRLLADCARCREAEAWVDTVEARRFDGWRAARPMWSARCRGSASGSCFADTDALLRRALEACECDRARAFSGALGDYDPAGAVEAQKRYNRRCQMPLPGSCLRRP